MARAAWRAPASACATSDTAIGQADTGQVDHPVVHQHLQVVSRLDLPGASQGSPATAAKPPSTQEAVEGQTQGPDV